LSLEAAVVAETPERELANLRRKFEARLRDEQRKLTALTVILERTILTPSIVYADIHTFAHRLRGAALVFEFREVGEAARVLELATECVSGEVRAKNQRTQVEASMGALMRALARSTARSGAVSC
jgi:hypothetical protein